MYLTPSHFIDFKYLFISPCKYMLHLGEYHIYMGKFYVRSLFTFLNEIVICNLKHLWSTS